MATNAAVYTGFWVNQAGNSVTGLTLTMQNGAFFVAFLAMVVRTAGKHFWQLSCFAFFHVLPWNSSQTESSVRQHRAVLRNSSSAPDGMANFFRLALRARKHGQKALLMPLSLASAAAINVLAFVFAAIFSSAVTGTESDVLLRPSTCGPIQSIPATWDQASFIRSMTLNSLIHQNMVTASQKSFNCDDNSLQTNGCDQQSIPYETRNIACPFSHDVCLNSGMGFELDTGFVDSYEGLGINTAKADRVTFRKIVQCAPLRTKGFSRPLSNESSIRTKGFSGPLNNESRIEGTNSPFVGYFYGPNVRIGTDYTFAFDPNKFKTSVGTAVGAPSYQIAVEAAAFAPGSVQTAASSSFDPIAGLRRPNVVVSLVFLSKQVAYTTPVNDPWFQATEMVWMNVTNDDLDKAEMQLYLANTPVSVLGCTEETLLSNASSGEDITHLNLVTHVNVKQDTFGLRWNKEQVSIVQRILDSLAYTALLQAAYSLNGNGLLAASKVQYNMCPGLPNEQWKLEVANWFSASINALQEFTLQYVTGYGRKDFNKLAGSPSPSDEWMCEQQIVRRDDYTSFNALGIIIILVISGAIVLVNTLLKRCVSRYRMKHYADTEWDSYDILNLQRSNVPSALKLPSSSKATSSADTPSRTRSRRRGLLPRLPWWRRRKTPILGASPTSAHSLSSDEKGESSTYTDSLVAPSTISPSSFKI